MMETVIFLEPKGSLLEVIREAKKRNFLVYTLSSDKSLLQSPPPVYRTALESIDAKYFIESWDDPAHLIEFVESICADKLDVVGIFFGTDHCAVPASILRKHFGLPAVEPTTMQAIVNKHQLRKKLREANLSNLETCPGSLVDTWDTWQLKRSGFFKPVHGSFSMYVQRCKSMADLAMAKDNWRKRADDIPLFIANFLRSKEEYHLEEEFDGELMSVEAIVEDGNFHVIGLTSRMFFSRNPVVETGACFPYPHPLSTEIFQFVERAHHILGLTEGATHTELIVNPEGEIEIIDLNPRFIGADHLPAINLACGIRIEEALLDWALGKQPDIKFTHALYSCLQYIMPPHDLCFKSIDFPEVDDIRFQTILVEPGTWVTSNDRETDFLGCYITIGSSYNTAVNRSRELRSGITINGSLLGAY